MFISVSAVLLSRLINYQVRSPSFSGILWPPPLVLILLLDDCNIMSLPVVAIIAPGAMGAAIAKRLTTSGLTVLTTLTNRSEATQLRARDAGMQDSALSDIARRARWVLSILLPSDALGFAQEFRSVYTDLPDGERDRAGSEKIAFVDCNAVNPETAKKIGSVFQGTPINFVDAAIIGFPPRPQDGYDPKLYASVDPKDDDTLKQFEELRRYGLKVCPLRGEGVGIGDASALKMSYGVSRPAVIVDFFADLVYIASGNRQRRNRFVRHHDSRYVCLLVPEYDRLGVVNASCSRHQLPTRPPPPRLPLSPTNSRLRNLSSSSTSPPQYPTCYQKPTGSSERWKRSRGSSEVKNG